MNAVRGVVVAGMALASMAGTTAPAWAAPEKQPVTPQECEASNGTVQRADDGVGTCVGATQYDGHIIDDVSTTPQAAEAQPGTAAAPAPAPGAAPAPAYAPAPGYAPAPPGYYYSSPAPQAAPAPAPPAQAAPAQRTAPSPADDADRSDERPADDRSADDAEGDDSDD